MKILFLTRAIFPSTSSHSLSIIRLCQAFTDSGHEVLLVGRSAEDNGAINIGTITAFYGVNGGFSVIAARPELSWLGRKFSGLFFRFVSGPVVFRRVARNFKPAVIYSRFTNTELIWVPRNCRLLYEMHSPGANTSSAIRRILFRVLLSRFRDASLVVTTTALEEYLRHSMPSIPRIKAPLSAPHPDFKVVVQESSPLVSCANERCSGDIGYTGYVDDSELRGIQTILNLAERLPNVCFHVVGGADVRVIEFWKSRAKSQEISGNLHFYGRRPPDEVPYFLRHFDAVISPTKYQTSKKNPFGMNSSPLKIPQYFAYGSVVIATDSPAHREYIVDGWNGILVDDDIDSWESAIINLLEDALLCDWISKNSKMTYFANHTPEGRVEKLLAQATP